MKKGSVTKLLYVLGGIVILAALIFLAFGHCVEGCYGFTQTLLIVWIIVSLILAINVAILGFKKNKTSWILIVISIIILRIIYPSFMGDWNGLFSR